MLLLLCQNSQAFFGYRFSVSIISKLKYTSILRPCRFVYFFDDQTFQRVTNSTLFSYLRPMLSAWNPVTGLPMLTKRKGSLILNEFMWITTQVHSTEQVASCNSLSQMLNLFLYKQKGKKK